MAEHLETGRMGEQVAADYLSEKGYEVLSRNWRFSRAEIDIIARKEDVLVFVEVKTRSSDFFGEPELSITDKKKTLLADAASVFMNTIQYESEFRFDIMSVILKDASSFHIKHYEDAFFPGLF